MKKAAAKKKASVKQVRATTVVKDAPASRRAEEERVPKNVISNTLSEPQLRVLINAYGDGSEMEKALVGALPDYHARTRLYAEAIFNLFHDSSESPPPEGKVTIDSDDRERCLIVLLASRGEQRNLALHIYIALMLGISPEEIGDLIFLAAVYTGVPTMADGFKTAHNTLLALVDVVKSGGDVGPNGVMQKLMGFPL